MSKRRSKRAKPHKWSDEDDRKLEEEVVKRSCEKCASIFRPDCECGVFRKQKTWSEIGAVLSLTYGQVQGRWCSRLDPFLDKSPWTPQLDERLWEMRSDPKYPTWVKKARALSESGMRRSGADVCSRFMKLKREKQRKLKRRRSNDDED